MATSDIKSKYIQFRSTVLQWIGIVSIILIIVDAVKYLIEKIDQHFEIKEDQGKAPDTGGSIKNYTAQDPE